MAQSLNAIYQDDDLPATSDLALRALRVDIHRQIGASFGDDAQEMKTEYVTDSGIKFDFDPNAKDVVGFTHETESNLIENLGRAAAATDLRELMFGTSQQQEGLVDRLIELARQAEREMAMQLGTGIYLDVYA